jgi:hypothetical protein
MKAQQNSLSLSFLLLIITLMPSALMQSFGFQSMTYGIIFSSISIILLRTINNRFYYQYSKKIFFYILIILIIVSFHSIVVNLFNADVDQFRLILSIFTLSIILLSLMSFNEYLISVPEKVFEKSTNIILLVLTILFLYGIAYFSASASMLNLIEYGNNLKKLFVFDEPSHLMGIILPFLLYKSIYIRSDLNRSIFIIFFSTLSVLLQSALGVVGLISISFIIFKKRILFIFFSIILIFFFLGFVTINTISKNPLFDKVKDTFIGNINIENYSTEDSNLSTLVLYWGYERAYKNTINTYGLGLGLQQLGIYGDQGSFKKLIILEQGCPDNVTIIAKKKVITCRAALELGNINLNLPVAGEFDGSNNFSKLVSEFGIFGIILILVYLKLLYRFFLKIRHISIYRKYTDISRIDTFFMCVFIMYFFDIFLRGTSYFSSSTYIFLLACLWLLKKNKKHSIIDYYYDK